MKGKSIKKADSVLQQDGKNGIVTHMKMIFRILEC